MEEMKEVDTREEHKKLCRLRGIIVGDVEELNDLKETKLMAAAAEGRFTCQHTRAFPTNAGVMDYDNAS